GAADQGKPGDKIRLIQGGIPDFAPAPFRMRTTANATAIMTGGKIAGDGFVWADPETARFSYWIRRIAAAPGGGINLITQYVNIRGLGLELADFLEQKGIFGRSDP